jgi:uncharacterized protein
VKLVFADTAFYQAFFNRQDMLHELATSMFDELDAAIVTTEYVLLELGAVMSRGALRGVFVDFIDRARRDTYTEIVPASPELFEQGLRLFSARPDKDWSMVDCISFTIMERRGIQDALTADRDYIQAGYRALLAPPLE